LRGRDYGRKSRHAAVSPWIAQGCDQSAVAAHRMAEDPTNITRSKGVLNEARQLQRDVILHAEVRRPGQLSGIAVETRALAQVIGRVICDSITAWTRVRCDDDQAVPRGVLLRTGLGDEILLSAGQAGEPLERWPPLAAQRGQRQVDTETHLAA
jgi:hypothetical protein